MFKLLENKVEQSILATESLFHKLILIVGENHTGKTSLINAISKRHHSDPININLELSKILLEFNKNQRQFELYDALKHIIICRCPMVFLDNIEILFDFELNQDPLQLLKKLSRNCTIVTTWNGKIYKERLYYAELGHREFRTYDISDFIVVEMNAEHEN